MTTNQLFRSFILGLLFMAALPFFTCGQSQTAANGEEPKIKTVFDAYTNAFFQEKLFIHTDKDSYLAGETMYMRAYRMDATTHFPQAYSGILYIEMRDPENQLLQRMQIIRTDSCFQATYKFPSEVSSGYYQMVAYTSWMQNFDEAFYFKKRFYVYNASDNNVAAKISYDPNLERNRIGAVVRMASSDGETYKNATIDIVPYSGSSKQAMITRNLDRDGNASFDLQVDAGITGLEIMFQNEEPLKYKKYFKMPIFDDSLDVQFMPEGGHLLNGIAQQVGFKAVGADGNGVNISGNIQDAEGNTVVFLESTHLGMGSFMLVPKFGERYRAEVTTEDGKVAMFDLPEVAEAGVGISTSIRGETLTCRILGTEGYDFSELYLGFHCRGKSYRWVPLSGPNVFNLPVVNLPDGIIHFFITNSAGDVFSERLAFVNKDLYPQVKVSGLRPSYGRRQKVDVDLNVLYNGTMPMNSEMSVSVIDPKATVVDKSENIISYVMLSSDIKGKIENPTYYFDVSVPVMERMRNADLLMMTQGWRRFDIGAYFRKEQPELPFVLEVGQSIAGNIKPLWRKSTDTGRLTLLGINQNLNMHIFSDVAADTNGNFEIKDISFPRGTTFIIQGSQKNGKTNVEVDLERQVFREYRFDAMAGRYVYHPDVEVPDTTSEYFQSIGRKYYYENGERVFAMDVVNVTARREQDSDREMYDEVSSRSVTGQELVDEAYYDIRSWLEASGVEVRENDSTMREQVFIRGRVASLWVDGFEEREHDMFLKLAMQDIDEIWIVRDPVGLAMVTGSASTEMDQGGVIVLTKSGAGLSSSPKETLSFFRFEPLGYSVPDQFYSPKYDGTDNAISYDERTTVHWDPNLKTGMDGKTNVTFYTTDVPTDFLMIIQGMSWMQTSPTSAPVGIPIYTEIPIKSAF